VAFFFSLDVSVDSNGSSALSDFSHTFGFPTNGDVFLLPPGVTVNAGTYLVDNRFVNPDAVAAVPEPQAWAAMIFGLVFVGSVAARRRRSLLAA
jgi:hypothetical protein